MMTLEEYTKMMLGQLSLQNCALAAEVDRLKAEMERLKNGKPHAPDDDPAR